MQTKDFSQGSVMKHILSIALPMSIAQFINVLYNMVDRMYLGRMGEYANNILAGVGLTFPILLMISAFGQFSASGSVPLFSIARGKKNIKEANELLGNSMGLMGLFSIICIIIFYIFKKPLLYMFGASDATYIYANEYLCIYLIGTFFVMVNVGMNGFINALGFSKIAMCSVIIGAIINITLDPLFIFYLDMGVKGAAIATIISQGISALWILSFLYRVNGELSLKKQYIKLQWNHIKRILALGLSGFVMALTNSTVQIVCNSTLSRYGSDMYVSIMTIIQSIREFISMPISGITSAAQPVLSFNYGAEKYGRVLKGIRFVSILCLGYTFVMWLIVHFYPQIFISFFIEDELVIQHAIEAVQIYYFGYFMMSLQFSGQSVFVALNQSKKAVFFSIFRKVLIVVPFTLYLPTIMDLGVNGVFLAEPISNVIGGAACFITMIFTVYIPLRKRYLLYEF